MQVPSPDDFRHEDGYETMPPWWARIAGENFDLFVPDRQGEPDRDSLDFAARVLPRLHELRAQAARYIGDVVQVRGIPTLDPEAAQFVSVFCEAASGTVFLELNWEADLYHLWHVRFGDHPVQGLKPLAFGRRAWGGSDAPWRAPAPPL
jgi:hypothetical protein